MKEIIALQEYTDKYISLYEGQIRNVTDGIADTLIDQGIVAQHEGGDSPTEVGLKVKIKSTQQGYELITPISEIRSFLQNNPTSRNIKLILAYPNPQNPEEIIEQEQLGTTVVLARDYSPTANGGITWYWVMYMTYASDPSPAIRTAIQLFSMVIKQDDVVTFSMHSGTYVTSSAY